MTNEVNVKDREPNIEYLRMALAMSEFGVTYEHADLINEVVSAVQAYGGRFSLKEGSEIFVKWKNKWEKYHTEQKTKPKP